MKEQVRAAQERLKLLQMPLGEYQVEKVMQPIPALEIINILNVLRKRNNSSTGRAYLI